MAFLLGLIPRSVRSDLHLLRKIRNVFAHNAGPLWFKTGNISDQCLSPNGWRAFGANSGREQFCTTMMGLLGVIQLRRFLTVRAPGSLDPKNLDLGELIGFFSKLKGQTLDAATTAKVEDLSTMYLGLLDQLPPGTKGKEELRCLLAPYLGIRSVADSDTPGSEAS